VFLNAPPSSPTFQKLALLCTFQKFPLLAAIQKMADQSKKSQAFLFSSPLSCVVRKPCEKLTHVSFAPFFPRIAPPCDR